MKFFKWHSDLNTGLAKIDQQHRELVKRINDFLKSSLKEPRDYKQMIDTFDFLKNYAIEHFSLEEKLMAEYQFPEERSHKADHKAFRKWVDYANSRIIDHEFTDDLTMQANYRLVEWLELHFRNRDRRLTDFLDKTAKEKPDPYLLNLFKELSGKKQ